MIYCRNERFDSCDCSIRNFPKEVDDVFLNYSEDKTVSVFNAEDSSA